MRQIDHLLGANFQQKIQKSLKKSEKYIDQLKAIAENKYRVFGMDIILDKIVVL